VADPRDEMVDGAGAIRPHWRELLALTASLGDELQQRADRLARAAEEDGLAAFLPSGEGTAPVWRCDPVPLPLPAEEFAPLAEGLDQRARLLEAVLADLYGPQRLLAEGRLPPSLVFGSPAYLRPCRNLPVRGVRLHFYAADLIRRPDGAWAVLADRTGGAHGLATALESRKLMARVLPELFRPGQVRPLRPFIDLWQDTLPRLAPPGRANPAVAWLTPGLGHPRWFEHVLLSRELACTLVEPGDLTVRGGGVFLKTLGGLQQVDVLLRRLDGRLLDPLELDAAATAGIPGLLDAARDGAVVITNHPGSALLETPGLIAHLPALAERLIGETLLLPQVQPGESPSTTPCLDGGRLAPRQVVLRLFLVHDGASWQAMPGGMARVLAEGEVPSGPLPPGGVCKDVWVLAGERIDILAPAPAPMPPLKLRRTAGELPSRVADQLFWFGRTVERADRAARLLRAAGARLGRGGAMLPREMAELECLLRCLVEAAILPAEAANAATPAALAQALRATVREGRERGAIARLFAEITRLTETVRDRLTGDMYATFTAALRAAREDIAAAGSSLDGLAHALAGVQRYSASVAGMAAENMVRGGGSLFLDLGRRIERAQAVVAEAAVALDQPPAHGEIGLRLLLELCDSSITYRSRYLAAIQPAPVLDLVLADAGNPRGLAFQLVAMHGLLGELEGEAEEAQEGLAATPAGLLVLGEQLVSDVLAAPDQAVAAAALPDRLRAMGAALAGLSDRVTRRYFALLPAPQALGRGETAGK
jgi:uncharacterized circularly permuted ATP-grasp superfamily protein/uncharacterized alpha-E superfamily protein